MAHHFILLQLNALDFNVNGAEKRFEHFASNFEFYYQQRVLNTFFLTLAISNPMMG